MNSNTETYTYRCGKKVKLEKNPYQFVVRALPNQIQGFGTTDLEQVSSTSTRVTTSSNNLEILMSVSRGIAPTHHAYQYKETGKEFLITDRIFVKFKNELSLKELNEFIAKYALVLKSKFSSSSYLFQLTNYTGMNPVKLVVKLTEEEALVASAGHDLNQRIQKHQDIIPSDPNYIQQWHLHERLNDPEFDPRSSTECEGAWELLGNYGSFEVVVGVTDDGCLLSHQDFDSPDKFASWGYFQGERLINRADFDALADNMYENGSNHGTSCAGVIAGEVDAMKTVGAAPACRLLPVKWESDGPSLFISDSKLITALNYMADKVDVISNSWGISPVGIWENEVLNTITTLSETGGRRGKGIVFLWAAGNENCPIDYTSDIEIPYTSGVQQLSDGSLVWVGVETSQEFIHNLVGLPGVMHVAALASNAQRSHYSNYGPGISLCAPSSNVHTYYRMEVEGLGITTTTGQNEGVTNFFGGTSSATPLVAGVAALVISANPILTAKEVISILNQTASKDLNLEAYPKTLPRDFDPDTSWDVSPVAPFDDGSFVDADLQDGTWSPWFGHGNVNALEAVREALSRINSDYDETVFSEISEPVLSIPDNDTEGVFDIISCAVGGSLKSISVSIDIIHTYIGDLIITLTAPSGKEVILQSRNGGSTKNLLKTFTFSNTATLLLLVGENMKGDWKLAVKDAANVDIGTLNNWSLEIKANNAIEIIVEENTGISIPDNNQSGIERTLVITDSGAIKDIEVAIDLTHTYIGDLTLQLISPQNDSFLLHNRIGGSADNIIKSYSIGNTPILADLRGKSIEGNWLLKITDHANVDVGKLNYWRVKVMV